MKYDVLIVGGLRSIPSLSFVLESIKDFKDVDSVLISTWREDWEMLDELEKQFIKNCVDKIVINPKPQFKQKNQGYLSYLYQKRLFLSGLDHLNNDNYILKIRTDMMASILNEEVKKSIRDRWVISEIAKPSSGKLFSHKVLAFNPKIYGWIHLRDLAYFGKNRDLRKFLHFSIEEQWGYSENHFPGDNAFFLSAVQDEYPIICDYWYRLDRHHHFYDKKISNIIKKRLEEDVLLPKYLLMYIATKLVILSENFVFNKRVLRPMDFTGISLLDIFSKNTRFTTFGAGVDIHIKSSEEDANRFLEGIIDGKLEKSKNYSALLAFVKLVKEGEADFQNYVPEFEEFIREFYDRPMMLKNTEVFNKENSDEKFEHLPKDFIDIVINSGKEGINRGYRYILRNWLNYSAKQRSNALLFLSSEGISKANFFYLLNIDELSFEDDKLRSIIFDNLLGRRAIQNPYKSVLGTATMIKISFIIHMRKFDIDRINQGYLLNYSKINVTGFDFEFFLPEKNRQEILESTIFKRGIDLFKIMNKKSFNRIFEIGNFLTKINFDETVDLAYNSRFIKGNVPFNPQLQNNLQKYDTRIWENYITKIDLTSLSQDKLRVISDQLNSTRYLNKTLIDLANNELLESNVYYSTKRVKNILESEFYKLSPQKRLFISLAKDEKAWWEDDFLWVKDLKKNGFEFQGIQGNKLYFSSLNLENLLLIKDLGYPGIFFPQWITPQTPVLFEIEIDIHKEYYLKIYLSRTTIENKNKKKKLINSYPWLITVLGNKNEDYDKLLVIFESRFDNYEKLIASLNGFINKF